MYFDFTSISLQIHFIFCDGVRASAVVVDVLLLLIFKLTKHKAPTLGELGPEHESVVSGQGGTHSVRFDRDTIKKNGSHNQKDISHFLLFIYICIKLRVTTRQSRVSGIIHVLVFIEFLPLTV